MRTLVTLGAMVMIAAASGCSVHVDVGTPTVSKDVLQDDIMSRLAGAGVEVESVTCKEDLVGEVGKTSRCEVVVSATNSFEPVVTVTGVEGSQVKYEMTPAVSKPQLERAVTRLLELRDGVRVDALSCESGLEGNLGAFTYCIVESNGVPVRRKVEVTKVDGLMMNFDLVPVLTKPEVERSLLDQLEGQLGRRPDTADCAGDLEGKPGATVECTVVGGDEVAVFTLTVTGVRGKTINYRFQAQG